MSRRKQRTSVRDFMSCPPFAGILVSLLYYTPAKKKEDIAIFTRKHILFFLCCVKHSVEPVFLIVKRLSGYGKARLRGISAGFAASKRRKRRVTFTGARLCFRYRF